MVYVYYVLQHPGGCEIVLEYAGCDASAAFMDKGHSPDAQLMLNDYYIGKLKPVRFYCCSATKDTYLKAHLHAD